ncbi:MAG: DUF5684 domain-containing protein [Clostridiaceae bacterium]|nr:DUF5684 domain-containing protein [Clostridiaceae bacterium]
MDYVTYGAYDSAASTMSAAALIPAIIIGVICCVIGIVAMWKIFTKAGEAGWKSIIPILNIYTYVKIADGNGVKFLLLCIPIVNIIFGIIFTVKFGKAFGKSGGFIAGLIFLPFIFMLILAFGSAQYVGPNGVPAVAQAPVAPPPAAE